MSTILNETIVSIHAAAALYPGRRPGKKLNFTTIWRWVTKGVRSTNGQLVRLEAVRLGARWVTSREAIARFSRRLTTPTDAPTTTSKRRTPSQRERDNQAAKKQLEKIGIELSGNT